MWILNRILNKSNSKSKLWWFLYIVNAYFSWNLPPGGGGLLFEEHKSRGWWVRTPLFSIGHYRNFPQQNKRGLFTGWRIAWLPNIPVRQGDMLYVHEWDNLKKVDYEIGIS